MGRVGNKVVDVEEGEISDTASVEEITEADFNKMEVKQPTTAEAKAKPEARVWTMQDVYKYQLKRGYTSGLHNLAWAQAVQNKPLNEVFDLEATLEDNSNSKRYLSANNKENKNGGTLSKEGDRVVIDVTGDEEDEKVVEVEKEERELEEGEIDLDWEPKAQISSEGDEDSSSDADKSLIELREIELRAALRSIVLSSSAILFDDVCTRFQHYMEHLRELVFVDHIPSKDSLLQLFFDAIQALHNVFCSMNHSKKEQSKEIWKRVLLLLLKDDPSFLPSKQIKEIEDMVGSLNCPSDLSITGVSNKDKNLQLIGGLNGGPSVASVGYRVNNSSELSNAAETVGLRNADASLESLKLGIKGRGLLVPLLDLHKDHDADSLPSPTHQAPPTLSLSRSYSSADGMFKPDHGSHKARNGIEDFRLHPYQNDALKAVSSYQQKFGRTSSFTADRLPSPTPSEEHACGTHDVGEEVSSSTSGNSIPPVSGRSLSSSLPFIDTCNAEGVNAAISLPTSSALNPPAKSLPKSRDPRLRFVNADTRSVDLALQASSSVRNPTKIEPFSGVTGTRKSRSTEDAAVDGSDLKRQRGELGNSGVATDPRTSAGAGALLDQISTSGWQPVRGPTLEVASDPRKTENRIAFPTHNNDKASLTGTGTDPLRIPNTSAAPLLPELFKGIAAVNPTMLANLLKIGQQQRFAAEGQQKTADVPRSMTLPLNTSSITGVPIPAAPIASGVINNPKVTPQVPGQISSTDDAGKIRMKPRDPRRILHESTLQRSGSLGSGQLTSGIATTRPQVEVPSQPVAAPDIAQQFTQSLKNVADIMSASQALPSAPVVSPNHASQSLQTSSGMDVKTIGSSNPELQTGNHPVVHAGSSVSSPPQNSWGDVEHLFEGYDDQQKAAIQRERARRIEEQKKMFSARKLCLVLDLDHTLLNSAKFVEVDPVHDEMLRKKEELDRDKPQRHLFRFPHMAMWTKLRPGIWNFLEKASKLYELHLYTMGNKLYATEMAKVLDPKGVLFAGRVISRGGDGDSADGDDRCPKSKDLEGVLGMESAVVIIDDSVRVWPHNKLNLIVVERYTYFPSSRRQFGLLGPSLLEIDHDERPEDGTLASSLSVIERIHQIFFSHQSLDDIDVRNILAEEQQKILSGCRIVFSRVFPVGEANPHLHPLWQTAEQFGAVCTNQIDDQVTHVVANALGTDKVNWALSTGRFVVYPGWVEASALLYRRANEQDFAIKT